MEYRASEEFYRGVWTANPLLTMSLGLCPALAVCTTLKQGLALGVATALALIGANALVSLFRKLIPERTRIVYHATIAALVATVVGILMRKYVPHVSESLGIYVPLIAVNSILLGRAGEYAAHNILGHSIVDGSAVGLGFMLALTPLSAVRELVGSHTLWGIPVLSTVEPLRFAVLAPGGFLILGLSIAAINCLRMRKEGRAT